MRPRSLPVLALLFVAAAACGGSRAPMPPAPRPGEQIRRLDVGLEVRRDGVTEVVETIRYDFGPSPRGSFTRVLTAGGTTVNRGTGLGRVRGSAASGVRPAITSYGRGEGPLPVDGRQTVVRFAGSFDRIETFQIRYELRYVLSEGGGLVGLVHDVVGEHSRVPVQRMGLRVDGPGPVDSFTCFRDAARDLCGGARRAGASATAELGSLPAGTRVQVQAEFRTENATVLEEPSDRYVRYLVTGGVILAVVFLGVVGLVALMSGSAPAPVPARRTAPRHPLGRERSAPDFEGAASFSQEVVNELTSPDPTDTAGSIGPDQDQL